MTPDESLLERVARKLAEAPTYGNQGEVASLHALAQRTFSQAMPGESRASEPSFDGDAALLFQALVEAAYLVGNADGAFDEAERAAFGHLVLTACGDAVDERSLEALLDDLSLSLAEDGVERRVRVVGASIERPEHAREVLRVAALIALVSEGLCPEERAVLEGLADAMDVARDELERIIDEAADAFRLSIA